MNPRLRAITSTAVLLSGLWSLAALAECRIDWHPTGRGLLAVLVDGQPYRGRAYVHHADVTSLAKVLASTGQCDGKTTKLPCSVQAAGAGTFQVHFGPRPLYSDEFHTSRAAARERAQSLVQLGFCRSGS